MSTTSPDLDSPTLDAGEDGDDVPGQGVYSALKGTLPAAATTFHR